MASEYQAGDVESMRIHCAFRPSVRAPRAGSTKPLIVHLGSAHDHRSLACRLRVHDSDAAMVAGAVEFCEAETVWRLVPKHPWAATRHHITVDGHLAGNRQGFSFDQPLGAAPADWTRALAFHPAAPMQ